MYYVVLNWSYFSDIPQYVLDSIKYEFPEGRFTVRSPFGADKFFRANRIGLKRAQNKTIYPPQSESGKNLSPPIRLALQNFSAPIGEVSNEFEWKKIGAEALFSLITSCTRICWH